MRKWLQGIAKGQSAAFYHAARLDCRASLAMTKIMWGMLCLVVLLLPLPAMAEDKLPGFLHPYLNAEAPRGHATFRRLFMKVYTANLWSDVDDLDYQHNFALSLTYDVSIDSNAFVDSTLEKMAQVTGKTKEDFEYSRGALMRAFPGMKPGDTFTALYVPKEPVRFFYNGHPTGEIREKGFAEAFFGIWISENSPDPSFRAVLVE